ncbi:MAG: DUF4170 domain-containing protein [Rhodospirillaceae bacterium]
MVEQNFFVIGGEYADTSFEQLVDGKEKEVYGPFSEREARDFWRSITGKTIDNAMIRYVLTSAEDINAKIYWVFGGEYSDTSFTSLASGKELEMYGPFEKWEALGFWRGITSKSVDEALVRYDIRERWEGTSLLDEKVSN